MSISFLPEHRDAAEAFTFSVAEVAKVIGKSEPTVRRYIRDGLLWAHEEEGVRGPRVTLLSLRGLLEDRVDLAVRMSIAEGAP